MFHGIVVPLDGSDFSRTALPYAVALASGSEATLALVSAFDSVAALSGGGYASADLSAAAPGFATPSEVPTVTEDFLQASRSGREKDLETTAEGLQPATQASVRWAVLDGEPSEAIAAEVASSGADAVVMSTHGRGGIERAWLGSVADRLVRRVTVPVLLVRPSEDAGATGPDAPSAPPAIRRVLVPLDGSPLAEAALEPATRAVRRFDASLILVRVTGHGLIVGSPYIPHAAEEQKEHLAGQEREAREYLEGVAERLRTDDVAVAAVEVRHGSPAAVILDLAHEGADMVVMATHGRRGFRRWVLGSVSDKVLRGADLPVLLVRPAEEAGPEPART